jgi:hypothetical protein
MPTAIDFFSSASFSSVPAWMMASLEGKISSLGCPVAKRSSRVSAFSYLSTGDSGLFTAQ